MSTQNKTKAVLQLLAVAAAVSLSGYAVSAAETPFRPGIARLELERRQVLPGQTLQATYTFQSSGSAPTDLTVFVHLVRPDGRHIGADFEPDLPTTDWPQNGFVREGPFPISVPDDAAPGQYQIWVGMFSPDGGSASNSTTPIASAVIASTTSATSKSWRRAAKRTRSLRCSTGCRWTKRRCQSAVPASFRRPGHAGAPHAVGGSEVPQPRARTGSREADPHRILRRRFPARSAPTNAALKARTKNASGNVGSWRSTATRSCPWKAASPPSRRRSCKRGRRIKATTDVVVRPFYRDYHQTLVMKLFLGMEGEPVERLAKEPLFQKKHDVLCTFEEALEVIRKADNLTRGIPKIIYLVGWQKGGHDHGYPAWSEVNPRLKRQQDATALDSLRWLIREARRFNTTVSLHINMVDAYRQSPLWDEYVAKDCLARDANGQLLIAGDPHERRRHVQCGLSQGMGGGSGAAAH